MDNTSENKKEYIEIRMPATGNDAVCYPGKNYWYEIRGCTKIDNEYQTSHDIARFQVQQIFGKKPKEKYLMQNDAKINYGIYLIQQYDYRARYPDTGLRNTDIRFTRNSANTCAYEHAKMFANEIAKKENLSDIVDKVEDDISKLKKLCENPQKYA